MGGTRKRGFENRGDVRASVSFFFLLIIDDFLNVLRFYLSRSGGLVISQTLFQFVVWASRVLIFGFFPIAKKGVEEKGVCPAFAKMLGELSDGILLSK